MSTTMQAARLVTTRDGDVLCVVPDSYEMPADIRSEFPGLHGAPNDINGTMVYWCQDDDDTAALVDAINAD